VNADTYVAPFVRAAADVLPSMLDLAVTGGQPQPEGDSFRSRGFTVIVGFTGGWSGRFFLDMSQDTALQLAGLLTGEQYHSVAEEEVLLSCAEIGNIISGHAITEVNDRLPGCGIRLTPPSVFAGTEVSMFNVKLSSWSVVMSTAAGDLRLNVAVEEARS
jgi:chemotaxis protein CheX